MPELEMVVEAGLTFIQAIQTASLNVAQAWNKDKDYGSIEKGKVADLVIVRGDPRQKFRYTKCRDGLYGRKGNGHFISSGIQEPDPTAD
jgi:imidazolonepropionase-like amidohydrolase